MKMPQIQTALCFAFLLGYAAVKFFAGYQGYSHAYAIQVLLIVVLTAVIPYYGTRLFMRLERLQIPAIILLPAAISMAGYATFYFVFIAPNFPGVTAMQVIPRGILPGVTLSAILLLPWIASVFSRRNEAKIS